MCSDNTDTIPSPELSATKMNHSTPPGQDEPDQVFDTLSDAMSSIGISTYRVVTIDDKGTYAEINSDVFDLNYTSTSDWSGFDSAGLCSLCSGITATALASPEGYTHAPSLMTLFSAAHENCCLCHHMREVANGIPNAKKDELSKPIRMTLVRHGEEKALAGSAISFRVGDLEIPGIQAKLYVRCFEGTVAPL
jgi:hypothetical protein